MIYARCSTAKQKENLERGGQTMTLETVYQWIKLPETQLLLFSLWLLIVGVGLYTWEVLMGIMRNKKPDNYISIDELLKNQKVGRDD